MENISYNLQNDSPRQLIGDFGRLTPRLVSYDTQDTFIVWLFAFWFALPSIHMFISVACSGRPSRCVIQSRTHHPIYAHPFMGWSYPPASLRDFENADNVTRLSRSGHDAR